MRIPCQKCKYQNEKEALFCAECGEYLEENKLRGDELFLGLFLILFIFGLLVLVGLSLSHTFTQVSPFQQSNREEQILPISIETLKKKLNNIKNKDTFESTQEYHNRKINFIKSIPPLNIGTLSMSSYDADKEELSYTLVFNKGFKTYISTYIDTNKSFIVPMKREIARNIFSKEKTTILYGKAKAKNIFDFFIWVKNRKFYISYYFNKNINLVLSSQSKLIGTHIWEDHVNIKRKKWREAMDYCNTLTLDSSSNWKLPTKEALRELYKDKYKNKLIHQLSKFYWSSTTDAFNGSGAWGIYFDEGFDNVVNKNKRCYVRCVRDYSTIIY
jgi:predicted nucleic acid-binding Zn ribbon protein